VRDLRREALPEARNRSSNSKGVRALRDLDGGSGEAKRQPARGNLWVHNLNLTLVGGQVPQNTRDLVFSGSQFSGVNPESGLTGDLSGR
jgi:hypothetical protein